MRIELFISDEEINKLLNGGTIDLFDLKVSGYQRSLIDVSTRGSVLSTPGGTAELSLYSDDVFSYRINVSGDIEEQG